MDGWMGTHNTDCSGPLKWKQKYNKNKNKMLPEPKYLNKMLANAIKQKLNILKI